MLVIQIEARPLNTGDANKIKKWLSEPAYFLFQNHLRARAAIKAADAANFLIGETEADAIDARNSAEEARTLSKLSEALANMRADDEHFTTVELKPTPPL